MKLTVLAENEAGGKFFAEHGLSYLIEIDGEQILFDTGHSDVFLKNAAKLGIDIYNKVEKIVLSHGHWDHGDGLKYLKKKILISHPKAFDSRYRKTDHSPVGLSVSVNQITDQFYLIETMRSCRITDNLFFLGEIPRVNDFESKTTPFEFANGTDDFVMDDSALAATVNSELVIVTGCSHSGICNICEHAKAVTGISKIKTVMGGFHLKFQNQQTLKTIEYFKKNKVEKLFPSHCTEHPALLAFNESFKLEQVKTGQQFEL